MYKFFSLILLIILSSCGESNSNVKYSSNTDYVTPNNGDLSFDNSYVDSSTITKEIVPEKNPKEILEEQGWKSTEINNGQMSSCYNFKQKKGKVDNSLKITVGNGTDVVIKLMDVNTNKCIRYVFINRNTTYSIRNIPEGQYYLKIAYGKNWYSKTENGKCIGKFIENAIYEKGKDKIDFNIIHSYDGYQIPSYELELDVISSDIVNSFNSTTISEESFNN
ncbi:hypothetical protein [Chishuiella sp.]|uniref:hypothetical protein n=1 Tax=Chishuiella sp. TaxID=1969467 RepID=UPI0028A88274|nr:hypothetical protein [Chishuiella sp.]